MMSHFAVLCPAASGHVNPMSVLLDELQRRGHRILWINCADGVDMVAGRGFPAATIGQQQYPVGTAARVMAQLGQLKGLAAARYTIAAFEEMQTCVLAEAPPVVRDSGATTLICDETVFCGRTIAEIAGLPWVSVCGALPFHPDPDLPPFAWRYRTDAWGRWRNRLGGQLIRIGFRRVCRIIDQARRRHGLERYDYLRENISTLATLAQIPEVFDFPRRNKLPWLHYVGGLHDPCVRPPVEFPFDKLDGRPLIYASLGTAQNRLLHIFRAIAAGCADLPAQLVIAMGGGGVPDDLGPLPGNPIVVPYAPQLELIRRARLVITHAGMNTTMESLAAGVPLVAIPITNDQPMVAARIAWTGCGEVITLRRASASRIANAAARVLNDPSYRENATRIAEANRRAGGVRRAADVIEQVTAPRES